MNFKITYVRGKKQRGRRRGVPPRYPPQLWNVYDAVRQKRSRTNNLAEGWHNRFQVVVGRYHPSAFAFFSELQKEQASTETMLRQLNIGKKIKRARTPAQKRLETCIYNVVSRYEHLKEEGGNMHYLKSVAHHISF